MRKILIPILTIVLAAALLLGMYNGLLGLRQANEAKELQAKMETILPGSTTFAEEVYAGEDTNIHRVWKGETGYIVETITYGYAGNITMLIGVHNDGYVTGMQIRDMHETYGLGKEALTDWEFLAQFLHTEGDAEIGNGIDAISGATVTSKAVTRSVNSAVGFVTGADTSSGATYWGG